MANINVRPLNEAVAVLTGSTSSIALEIACQLAEAGVPRLVLNGRDATRGAAAVAALRSRAPTADVRFVAGDATVPEVARAIADDALASFGRIDILVNSIGGGGGGPTPFHQIDPALFQEMIDRQFLSTIRVCRAVIPHMIAQNGGVILNMGSDSGRVPTPGATVLGALKAAVIMFTRTLALESARHGVRVHCLSPSIVRDTLLYDRLMATDFGRRLFSKAEEKAALGVTTPKDIAALAVFLASPAAANMTGQVVSINGGISVP